VRVTPWSRFVLEKLQFFGESRSFVHILEPGCPFLPSQMTPAHNNALYFHKVQLSKSIVSVLDEGIEKFFINSFGKFTIFSINIKKMCINIGNLGALPVRVKQL
jgi:hypothetical protein